MGKTTYRVRIKFTEKSVPYKVVCDGVFNDTHGIMFYNGNIDSSEDKNWNIVLYVPYTQLVEFHEIEFEDKADGISMPGGEFYD